MEKLGAALGMDWTGAARGISDVVNENMANMARVHAAERGRDLQQYTLIANRYRLAVGQQFRGPAIVEERESTAVLGPRAQVEVDRYLNLRVTIE